MAWHEGAQIGPYTIEEMIGQGGMATVYKAYHAQLDRHVALKVMLQNYQDDEGFVSRFQREARIVALLDHPHIVPVYDYSQHEGQPYLVMKFIEGRTLKQHLIKRTLPLDEILRLMTAVGSALTYAHEHGILHRDIKPSNIVIDRDNVPYVTDFGLARMVHLGESTLSADMLLGTPHYIAPEQARGDRDLDGRSDLYALGVILYELLVGHVPFTGDTPYAIIHDHIYSPLPRPSLLNPEIPEDVEDVLLKALAKNREDRYPTGDDMVAALKAAIEQTHLEALSESRIETASIAWERSKAEWAIPHDSTPSQAAFARLGTQAASASAPAPMATQTRRAKTANRGRLWRGIGCAGFLISLLISGLIVLGTANNMLELRELDLARGNNPTAVPESAPDNTLNEGADYPVMAVDSLSVADAQALVATEPDSATSYLTLARAQWADGDDLAAQQTVSHGIGAANDTNIYFINAAALADQYDDAESALIYHVLALLNPSSNTEETQAIRDASVEYLYTYVGTMENLQLNDLSGDLFRLTDGQLTIRNIADSPIATYITAIKLLQEGNLVLANRSIVDLENTDEFAAVTDLLLADLHIKRGQNARAVLALRAILDNDRAPEWVQQQAEIKLKELESAS